MNNIVAAPLYPWLVDSYQHLQDLLTHNKLPSVLLLSGPQGFGKASLALKIAHLLNGQDSQDSAGLGFNLLGDENSGNNQIKIDDIRSIISLSHHTNMYGAQKVNIILNIENLTQAAGNALLKSLEDNNNTSYIFTTSCMDQVLPTILSRCYKPNLVLNKNSILKQQNDWLAVNGLADPASRELLLEIANFGPLQALNYYNLGYLEKLQALELIISNLNNNLSSSLSSVKELFQHSVDNKLKFNMGDFLTLMYYVLTKNNLKNATNLLLNYRKKLGLGIALDSDNIIYELLYIVSAQSVN